MEVANHGVDLWSNTCSSRLLSQKADFTKELSTSQGSHRCVTLRNRILDKDFALAMFDEEETVVFLSLVDQWVLRVQEHKLERLDEEVNKILVLVKQLTLHCDFLEYQLND